MLRFRWQYFVLAIILLIKEILIAIFIHDNFIRPYVGDFLVVILIYCLLQSIFKLPVWTAAPLVLIFAYAVEILQCFKIVEKLGFQENRVANILIGTSFEWKDLLMYTLGIGLVLFVERNTIGKSG